MKNPNLKNLCVVCKESVGTCEDREAGGLTCGECLANLVSINFELDWMDKFGEFNRVSQNPNDLVDYDLPNLEAKIDIQEENTEF